MLPLQRVYVYYVRTLWQNWQNLDTWMIKSLFINKFTGYVIVCIINRVLSVNSRVATHYHYHYQYHYLSFAQCWVVVGKTRFLHLTWLKGHNVVSAIIIQKKKQRDQYNAALSLWLIFCLYIKREWEGSCKTSE